MRTLGQREKGPVIVLASVVLGAGAQMFLKAGMLVLAETGDRSLHSLAPVISWLGVGVVCYATSMVFWLLALSRYELSVAYPVLGLSYPLVFLGAVFCPFFGEEMSISRVTGIGLILVGVTLVTQTEGRRNRD